LSDPLWITYEWSDNAEGHFDFLVQELSMARIPAKYDRIALIPGRKLWAQIADRISTDPLSGWAYLVTPSSLDSAACKEELAYAIQRALNTRGEEFPLIGLLHDVSIRDVPLALQVRLCIDLKNPDWIEELRAAVNGVAPRRSVPAQGPFVVRVHDNYLNRGIVAVENPPRFGELRYWRFDLRLMGRNRLGGGLDPPTGAPLPE
jgi:TIR domain